MNVSGVISVFGRPSDGVLIGVGEAKGVTLRLSAAGEALAGRTVVGTGVACGSVQGVAGAVGDTVGDGAASVGWMVGIGVAGIVAVGCKTVFGGL